MLEVVGHRLMIMPDPVEKKTESGIILGIDEKKYREATMSGKVVGIGPNAFVGFGDSTPWCSIGDHIIFARHSGKFVSDPQTKEEFYVINDEDVQVVIKEKGKD